MSGTLVIGHPIRARARGLVAPAGWRPGAALALLCSGVAVAALPASTEARAGEELQWQALGIAPMMGGARTGMRQAATEAVEPIDFAPDRATVRLSMTLGPGDSMAALLRRSGASYADSIHAAGLIAGAGARIAAGTPVSVLLGAKAGAARSIEQVALRAGLTMDLQVVRTAQGLALVKQAIPVDTTPLRIRGRVGDGMYWSLRAAGVSPQSAAEYLRALATQIDVGSEIGSDDRFDLVIASRRIASGERQTGPLLYAGIDRRAERDLQLLKWGSGRAAAWVEAGSIGQPTASAGMAMPVRAPITSGFGYRVHPILRFARMHRGVDFGAGWGAPIVAAADGQVTKAGWAGGYGRQVRIAHGGGLSTSYSHMSRMVAEPGSIVRQGEVIGYVGSSGLSTGPHLHYEVYRSGQAVNPLSVRFAGAPMVDHRQVAAFKARLKALLSVGA